MDNPLAMACDRCRVVRNTDRDPDCDIQLCEACRAVHRCGASDADTTRKTHLTHVCQRRTLCGLAIVDAMPLQYARYGEWTYLDHIGNLCLRCFNVALNT